MAKDQRETTCHHLVVGGGFGGGGRWDDGDHEQKGRSRRDHHFRQDVRWDENNSHTQQSMQPIVQDNDGEDHVPAACQELL